MPLQEEVRQHRDPDRTRAAILGAAFRQIYAHGYQGMRLDEVLADTGLTKGALYHHFPNKQALGYAVVDEVIAGIICDLWCKPLEAADRPLDRLIELVEAVGDMAGVDVITYGCPLNNLAQEMSPLDEGFRRRIDHVYREWHRGLRDALERARRLGQMCDDSDPGEIASFVLGALSGCIGIAKNAQSRDQLRTCLAGLTRFLRSLSC